MVLAKDEVEPQRAHEVGDAEPCVADVDEPARGVARGHRPVAQQEVRHEQPAHEQQARRARHHQQRDAPRFQRLEVASRRNGNGREGGTRCVKRTWLLFPPSYACRLEGRGKASASERTNNRTVPSDNHNQHRKRVREREQAPRDVELAVDEKGWKVALRDVRDHFHEREHDCRRVQRFGKERNRSIARAVRKEASSLAQIAQEERT